MSNFKEIVTKAVVGKAKKSNSNKFVMNTEQTPDTILGCWVINHKFAGSANNGVVDLNGSFDVNVWYSYENDTKTAVSTRTYNYNDKMPVHLKDGGKLDNSAEIIVRSLRQPTVKEVYINNGNVNLNVEKELGVEVIGDTKIKVSIEEDEDDYEEIIEEIPLEEENKIDEVNEDYLDSVNQN